jgi:hypothetical protein
LSFNKISGLIPTSIGENDKTQRVRIIHEQNLRKLPEALGKLGKI